MEEQPNPIPEEPRSKEGSQSLFTINWSNFRTLSVVLISLFALFVSLYQTKILVEQQRLSGEVARAQLWPRLEASLEGIFYGEGICREAKFVVANVGIGPAIVQDFYLLYEDDRLESWWGLCKRLIDKDLFDQGAFSMTNSSPLNVVLQPGERRELFVIKPKDPEAYADFFAQLFSEDGPQIFLCYASVFGDEWRISDVLNGELLSQEGC